MVSALSRKESDRNMTQPVKLRRDWIKEISSSAIATSKDNFPYALQEFINSHMNLPTFDEIVGKSDKLTYSIKMAG